MSSKNIRVPSKRELIADLKQVAIKFPDSPITRNFYRGNGKFTDADWQYYFPSFQHFLAHAGIEPINKKPDQPETITVAGDKLDIFLPKTRIHTLPELLAHCEVDLQEYEVITFVVNKWEMNTKREGIAPLFQVKATLKKRVAINNIRKEIELLKDDAKKNGRTPSPVVRSILRSGNLLEINIPDAHFGKLAWGVETGYENYDTSIAEKIFIRALETLLDRVKSHKFDQVLFVVGNDLFNSDDQEGRTTKGTNVTTDGRYHKTFYKVRRCITKCIERLRQIAPVKVLMVSGNHDQMSVWHLGDSLECYFHKYADVEIENTPIYRKYHQHGQVMLMFTHGDKAKRTDYPLLMASEQREMWGSTRFRECHTGHTHMTKMDEQHGVRVRVLPALCPPDDWHAENGFVGNLRNAEAYVWNKDEGLVNQAFYNDESQPAITTSREIKIAA